jgi:hypothetical protein
MQALASHVHDTFYRELFIHTRGVSAEHDIKEYDVIMLTMEKEFID